MAYSLRAVTRNSHRFPLAGLLSLLVTYVVWGSTYLAIRVAVREGAGWGPFWLGATRVLVAAAVLFAFNAFRGARLRPTRAEFGILAATGILLWVGGDRKSTRLNSSHSLLSRMPSSA